MSDSANQPHESSGSYGELIRRAREQADAARERELMTAALPPDGVDPAGCLQDLEPCPLPDSLPGYDILREIHRGGQGVVYQALQKTTRRKVAVKVMREGPFAGRQDKVRFEREVQVLAQLKHPGVVSVLDSGQAGGCFYFVMDYISGQPLDVYLASARLAIPALLQLFARICDAVHAAHLRGVIHRDLKPGNIRIDAEGNPHVLDFGLARVAGGQYGPVEDGQAMTMTGTFVGTLPYASPEQAEGLPSKIDIRTDVYSLGVILYQALTGNFPYVTTGPMSDALQNILHAEPKPAHQLRPEVDDEVDTIVRKCLCKERERRYQSAGELARDIRHYLAGEPIEAKRDSTVYLLRKMLRRYKLAAGVAAAFLVLVVGSVISLSILYGQAVTARNRAEHEAEKARQMTEFIQRIIMAVGENGKAVDGPTVLVTTVLDRGRKNIQAPMYRNDRETAAWVRNILGNCYLGLGLLDDAEPLLESALQDRRQLLGDQHPDTLTSSYDLARLLQRRGELAKAKRMMSDELAKAKRMMSETLAARRHVLRAGHVDTLESMEGLADVLADQGQWPEAIELYREAAALCRDSRPQYAGMLRFRMGQCLSHIGKGAEAEREMLDGYEEMLAAYGPEHDYTLRARRGLAEYYLQQGRPEEAQKYQEPPPAPPASPQSVPESGPAGRPLRHPQ